jgi:hypothetical protein
MRLTSIFGNADHSSDAAPAPAVERFECTADNGALSVVRVTFGSAAPLATERLRLAASAQGAAYRFPALDGGEEDSAEFLLPSALLSGDNFVLETASGSIDLPELILVPGGPISGTELDAPFLAQQERLADAEERLEELRVRLREQRERTARAEEELEDGTTRFSGALLSHRRELHEAQARVEALEAEAAEAREEARRERELRATEGDPLRAAIDEARQAGEAERARAEALEGELDDARRANASQAAALEEMRERERLVMEDLEGVRARIDEEQRGRAEAVRRADAAETEVAQQQGRIEALTAEIDALRANQQALARERDEVRAILESEREAHAAVQENSEAELTALRSALEEERARAQDAGPTAQDVEDMRQMVEKSQADLGRLEESGAEAARRIAELERENQELDGRRETAESAMADMRALASEQRAALDHERSDKAEALARLDAVEIALDNARAARYRAEQEALELKAALAAHSRASREGDDSGVPVAAGMPEPEAPGPAAMAALGESEDPPFVSAESLAALDFDSLAESYDIAAGAWRIHARTGDDERAGRWRAVALQLVDEAAGREEVRLDAADTGRRLRSRHHRLREQLREACAERWGSADGT